MAALITGALGHIGRWVTQQILETGEHVVAVDVQTTSGIPAELAAHLATGLLRYEQVDVLDVDALDRVFSSGGIDGVIHVAGISGLPGFDDAPRRPLELNLMGMVNILDGARRHGVRRVVHVSSGAVYGTREGILREDDPCEPADLYSVAKLAGEQIARQFAVTHSLDLTCARVFFVYGPGRHPSDMWWPAELIFGPLVGLMGANAEAGGHQALDFTHVFDAAAGIVALYRASNLPSQVYNISSGTASTVADAVATVAEAVGADTGVRVGPGKVTRRGSPLDITRAMRDVGYRPRFANLRDGVAHYYQWLREHHEETEWTTGRTLPPIGGSASRPMP